MRKRLLLIFASVLLCFVVSVAADRAVGLFGSHVPGLIFPPNVARHFQTPEFSFTVTTNSLGFRDREFGAQKTAHTRILAFGDSFTYGWGVEIDQSWPKILERRLRDGGLDVEVANLGKPAGSPRDYANIAEKAVPLLKPDLLIIAVLQGDDLAQLDLQPPKPDTVSALNNPTDTSIKHPRVREVATRLYPHFVELMDKRVNSDSTLAEQWKKEAQIFLDFFTLPEKKRFESIDAGVRQSFLNGELNPALIYLSVHDPNYFSKTMDFRSPAVQSWISRMAEQFMRIRNIARQHNAEVLIVSMPYGIYVSPNSFQSRQRLGFTTAAEMLKSSNEDEAIRSACQMAGVNFYEFTREFRQASTHRDLFFELDGHINAQGHGYFAEVITPLIKETTIARDSR